MSPIASSLPAAPAARPGALWRVGARSAAHLRRGAPGSAFPRSHFVPRAATVSAPDASPFTRDLYVSSRSEGAMARAPTTVPDLNVQSPVPSDIAIAQSAKILPIARIAEDLGLDADEFIPYGDTKAKARIRRGRGRGEGERGENRGAGEASFAGPQDRDDAPPPDGKGRKRRGRERANEGAKESRGGEGEREMRRRRSGRGREEDACAHAPGLAGPSPWPTRTHPVCLHTQPPTTRLPTPSAPSLPPSPHHTAHPLRSLSPPLPPPPPSSPLRVSPPCHLPPLPRSPSPLPVTSVSSPHLAPFSVQIRLTAAERHADRGRGVYVVVAGITPTPLGEGKSTTTVGLCQALGAHVGVPAIAAVRQPSQGPTFGIKGGAAGGGYAQVVPMEEFNLHLTGDIHAISAAHNLVAAAMDARMLHEATQSDEALFRRLTTTGKGERAFVASQRRRLERLGIDSSLSPLELDASQRRLFARVDLDPATITWRRALDINDRSLRGVRIGLGPEEAKRIAPRDTGFDIAVASELMAILALATDLDDLKRRAARAVVGRSRPDPATGETRPVTVDDLGVAGAVAVLLKDAVDPTLMQTLEGTPVLVHAGPFANVAHGNSSAIADRVGLALVGRDGAVVTEAGFGADIGFEKFVSIKCRASGLVPDVAVVVATVRALKMHGGAPAPSPGAPLPREYADPDPQLVAKGCANLARHVRNVRSVGVRCVVAVNVFASDAPEELEAVRRAALDAGADAAVECRHHALGGKGALDLAHQVLRVAREAREEREKENGTDATDTTSSSAPGGLRHLYPLDAPIAAKIDAVATKFYGAARAVLSERAAADAAALEAAGLGNLPVCMAKTQYSFSNDPALKGAPEGFDLEVREIRPSAGAGFLVALCGTMMMMPGLPTRPAFFDIDIEQDGTIVGLS